MTTEQCGVFATVIPVFLLASYLSLDMRELISDAKMLERISTAFGLLYFGAAETLALWGTQYGLDKQLGRVVLFATITALGSTVLLGATQLLLAKVRRNVTLLKDEAAQLRVTSLDKSLDLINLRLQRSNQHLEALVSLAKPDQHQDHPDQPQNR